MPVIVIFLGVLGGFLAFGFLGLFIGPTLLGVFYQLLQAWRDLPESSMSMHVTAGRDDMSVSKMKKPVEDLAQDQ